MGEEVEGLEDHADFCAQVGEFLTFFGQFFAVDGDGAVGDGFKTVDGAAEG